jgi:hypothetical protein
MIDDWYKDAVFYEVFVRAFADGNGDGNGDLPGLTTKLDYLRDLGVDCLWLLPIYPSPCRDDGYDVADYCGIHPDYGTVEDFATLVKEAHELRATLATRCTTNTETGTSGVRPTSATRRLVSSLSTTSHPTGPGTPCGRPTSGIAFSTTSPT